MALAVAEAHRVLRPAGWLLNVHPEGQPLQLQVWHPRPGAPATLAPAEMPDPAAFERVPLGRLRPYPALQDFTATTHAIAQAPAQGFATQQATSFEGHYFFDNLQALVDYLDESEELDNLEEALLDRTLAALQSAPHPPKLVLAQTVEVTVLRKEEIRE